MRALLFSNFPDRFLQDSVIPKLKTRGVSVDRVLSPRAASSITTPVPDVATVLFMHELSSHGENDAVKNFAERANLPLICISRKSALWGDRLPSVQSEVRSAPAVGTHIDTAATIAAAEVVATVVNSSETPASAPPDSNTGDENMPSNAVKSVPNELVEHMLRHMIKMHGHGTSYDDMVPELQQYWKSGTLESGKQLRSYLDNIYRRSNCPEFYKDWIEAGRPASDADVQEEPEPVEAAAEVADRRGKRPMFLRALSDKNLDRFVRKVTSLRDKGVPYKDIFPEIRKYWKEEDGPQDPDQLSKFMASIAISPRAPIGYKAWYDRVRRHGPAPKKIRRGKTAETASNRAAARTAAKPLAKIQVVDDAELARIYMEENEVLKKRLADVQSSQPKDVALIKAQLRELFASCQKLVDIGAMDVEATFNMVFQYLDRA